MSIRAVDKKMFRGMALTSMNVEIHLPTSKLARLEHAETRQSYTKFQGRVVIHVKRPTLPRYVWVVGFISLEQTSSLEVPFGNE
jgi:hypothetical protein